MHRLTEVVKNLIMINVLVFVVVKFLIPIRGVDRFFMLVTPGNTYIRDGVTYQFEPIQIVTHMFMHGSIGHLFFNMMGLYFLGPWVESALGAKRFLTLYLVCGLIASAPQVFFTQGMVLGASGAVYGVLAAFATMFPNVQLQLLIPPIPVKAKYLALIFIGVGIFSEITGSQPGIGHIAHIAGAVLGFIMIKYWGKENLR